MIRSKFVLQLIFLLGCFLGCKNTPDHPPYYSYTPLESPALFSDSITTRNGIAFSPNGSELYVSLQKPDTFDNGRQAAGIYKYEFVDGHWKGPNEIKINGLMDAYHPVLSSDGSRLFFNSRSHPDSGSAYLFHDIWFIEKMNQSWSSPQNIEAINTGRYESYPSVAANGNLYFNSDRPGGKGGMDFYMSEFRNGIYQKPMLLDILNSSNEENDLVVDTEERFIIFNRYIHADRSIDLWISIKEGGHWSPPKKLEHINKPDSWELTPSLSADGKYFFFEKNSQIWQVDLASIL